MNVDDRLLPIYRKVFANPGLVITDTTSPETLESWDSLLHLDLLNAIEKEFKVKFSTKEMAGLTDVAAIKSSLVAKGVV